MSNVPVIEVETRMPRIVVCGLAITTAPNVPSLHAVLGKPTRVDTGDPPAPHGHRNNHMHIYDELGLCFTEHHYTRLVQGVSLSFDVTEPLYRFSPRHPFRGRLLLDAVQMPLGGSESSFLGASPVQFERWLAGRWQYTFDGFSLHATARGPRLPSGKRSRKRSVIELSLSWPHDDWATPAIND